MISGFRYGFIGSSDIAGGDASVQHSALGLGLFNTLLGVTTYLVLRSGWKLKS